MYVILACTSSTVIGKPGNARLEGTPTMVLELEGIRSHMQTERREIEQNTYS